jgi:hypothetical protein
MLGTSGGSSWREELIPHLAISRLVGELEGLGAEPLGVDNRYEGIWENAAERGVRAQIFEFGQRRSRGGRGRLCYGRFRLGLPSLPLRP